MQEYKCLSEEALQIAEKRKVKNKEEQKRYTQLNAELQRISRRGKDFLSEQCTEIEEHNRDLFKKTQGSISCKDRHDKGQKQ